jgi:uncharacterized protein (TIGR03435 family)
MRPLAVSHVLAIALITGPVRPTAQAPPREPAGSRFDVASIKRNTSKGQETFSTISPAPGGRLVVRNTPLRRIIQVVYNVPPYALQGGPDWLDSTRFDIDARPVGEVPATQVYTMARALLEERFKLKTRVETREGAAGYALVLARRDGRLGNSVRRSASECTPPSPDATGLDALRCNLLTVTPRSIQMRGKTFQNFARALAPHVGRPVADRTGLDGPFDAEVRWAPDPAFEAQPALAAPAPAGDSMSLFTALEEQLGLKLVGERTTMEVVVIEHVEQPGDD